MWIKYLECNLHGKTENTNFNDSTSAIISIPMNCIVLKKSSKYTYSVKTHIFSEKIDISFTDIHIFQLAFTLKHIWDYMFCI